MADRAHILTDKELEEMERHLSAIYARAEKELQEKADKYFKRFEELDAKKRQLVEAGKMTEEEYKRWRQNKIMTGRHWTRMKEQAAQELLQANRTAQEYINGKLPGVYSLNYNSTGEAIQGAVSGYSFELVDASTVKNLATSDKTLLPYKYVDGKKDVRWNTAKVNSEVLQGILQGESIPKIAKRLQNVTEMNRASAIRNARTTVTSAENKGRMDSLHRAAEKGVITRKVWLAAIDARTREAHRLLDGQEQEIDDPFDSELGDIMYPGDPDADPANVYNCFVGETNIATDSEVIRSYKHDYSGRFVTVKTAGGVNFTCTPNHPILTIDGWVPAESLHKGNDILVAFRRNDVFRRVNPNINHVFSRIDAIHELFNMLGGDRAVSMSVNFHGDIPASDVEIITKKRFLRENLNSRRNKSVNKFFLKHSDKSFLRLRSFPKHFGRIWSSALGFIGGVSKSLSFFFAGLRHPEIHRLRPIALLYSGRVKPLDNDVARNAELISECLDGFSGFVFADNIVSVDFSSGCSHVYNLQTENGYYFVNSSIAQSKRKSNGIFAIAHNCRCTLTYKVVGFRKSETEEAISLLPEEERETYAERRRERLAARRQASVDFDTAPIADVQKYAETKLKTDIDFKGATEQAKRGLVKAVDRFEKAGGTVGNAKVVFGGTLGNYGYYDPKTNTIHLRTNNNFVEKMIEENARSMFKLGKPRWADPSYEGMAAHELGHAFDRYFGQEISREISRRGLLREAFSISGYASTEPAIGSPRASEAVAENIAAYLAGGAEKEKIAPEIIKILEEYFGKRK